MDKKVYRNNKINEEVISCELDSGLKIYFIPKKGYSKKYAIFATNYGSNDNRFIPIGEKNVLEVPQGVAHFLEHKLFEEPDEDIIDKFSRLGTDVNAYTNFNQTAYLFSCTDNFYESLELLIKFVQNPYFTNENVEKEKGIIAQEIKMYEDNPGWRVFFNCLRGMYYEHPVKIDIAGTVESIQKIDVNILYKCYNTFYNPKNMILVMTGDISFDKAVEAVERVEKKDINSSEDIVRIYNEEPNSIKEKYIEEKLITYMPIFAIGFKEKDIGFLGEKLIKREVTTNILLDMLFGQSSEFYQELYNEGIIDGSFGGQYTGHENYGHSVISGQSKNPELVLERIIKYLNELKSKGLKEEDFLRIKKKSMGSDLMGFNSVEFIANNFVNYYFLDYLFINLLDIYDKITFDDVFHRFNSHFDKDNYTLSVIKPM